MFQLKEYQRRCLDELAGYFGRIVGFLGVTDNPENPRSFKCPTRLE
jgi:hypothetical protein